MKAMDRVSRGRGFRGLLNYLHGRDGEAADLGRLIGGNMAGQSVAELAAEFRAVARQRPDIEKPVWHQALRLAPGESVTDEKWCEIGKEYLARLRFDPEKYQYALFAHDDERAIHICANRVAPDGAVYLGQNENLKSTHATQWLERRFGLTLTKGPEYQWETGKPTPRPKRKPRQGELREMERTESPSVRLQLQRLLDQALIDSPPLAVFLERLAAMQVRAFPNLATTGRMNGFSFELDGVAFKASQLGADYRWSRLKEVVAYDPDRDGQMLRALLLPGSRENCGSQAAKCVWPRPEPGQGHHRVSRRRQIEDLERRLRETEEQTRLLKHWEMVVNVAQGRIEFVAGHRRVVDYGDYIQATNGDEDEVNVMLVLARLKGWKALVFSGDDDFKLRAMTQALQAGFDVVATSAADKAILAVARRGEGFEDVRALAEAPHPASRP